MRGTRRILVPVLVAVIAFGCQPAPQQDEMEPERSMQQVEADFDALRADWQSMANADDVAGVAALYAPNAVFIDGYGNVFNGREAVTGYLEESFAAASDIAIETRELVVEGDMVAGYGTFSQTVMGPEGEMPVSGMWMTVAEYQPDGAPKLRLHMGMLPAEEPGGM